MQQNIAFHVSRLDACVPDGVPIYWQGREVNSGPLTIQLDDDSASRGVLDYGKRRAEVTFQVRLGFPELAATLQGLGVDASLTEPVRAELRSEGDILEDHSFLLSGLCELQPHAMFSGDHAAAAVLPGH